jgi:hypothetical protein
MSFTSSEIQKKLERGAFSIHIALKHIEALKAEIAGHEEQMYDTARSLYDNEVLVDAAIAMAQMSIPTLELRASKIVAGTGQSSLSPATGEETVTLIDASLNSVVPPVVDGDGLNADDEVSVVEQVAEGAGLAKIHADEFFGVEVPVSQLDLARDIKHEAAVSVKQNTKNNTYASDRGKNAWRKALFTRARAEYLKNGVPTDGVDASSENAASETTIVDTVLEVEVTLAEVVEDAAVEVTEDQAVEVDAVEVSEEVTEADEAVVAVEADVEADEVEIVAESVLVEIEDQNTVTETFDDQSDDEQVANVVLADVADEQDHDWLPETADDHIDAVNVVSGPVSAGLADIPFFDDPANVADDQDDAVAEDLISTVNDDHTLSITDTFFAEDDDDVPILDPISFDDDASGHDDDSSSDELEDIDVPDFDPNAELFDEKTPVAEHVMSEPFEETVIAEPVVVQTEESNEAPAPEPIQEASRRAVPISSIPAHQRPGAPRPQTATPARPQPGGASGRVVTAPSPRPVSTPPQSPTTSTAAPVVAPASPASAPSSASRVAPARAAPARTVEPPTRTHGFGAKVPAPPGLDEAIRERDAAVAAAKAAVTPAAPAKPVASPVRPGPTAPRGVPFTKPSFNR